MTGELKHWQYDRLRVDWRDSLIERAVTLDHRVLLLAGRREGDLHTVVTTRETL